MLCTALLSSSLPVVKRVIRKISALYFLFCCCAAWVTVLVWRGQREEWTWWLKILGIMLLSSAVVFIDALPFVTKSSIWKLMGLQIVALNAAATYFWLKVHTAESYSEYGPPEWRVGGFISLSSFQKCADFLFFQALHSFYAAYELWQRPGEAVFVSSKPQRDWR